MATLNVIDIGAYGGAHRRWNIGGSNVIMHCFEPDPAECDRLQNSPISPDLPKRQFYPYAIGTSNGQQDFYNTLSPRCSSLREPDEKLWEIYAAPNSLRNKRATVQSIRQVSTITMDKFCDINAFVPDFIKLDTQGSEYELLLEGGSQSLVSALGLEIEVEFVPLYKEQKLFSEIEIMLREKGYDVVGLLRNHWKMNDSVDCRSQLKGGRLTYADALFLRRDLFTEATAPLLALKASFIMIAYGLWDVAWRILKINNINPSKLSNLIVSKNTLKEFCVQSGLAGNAEQEVGYDKEYGCD